MVMRLLLIHFCGDKGNRHADEAAGMRWS
ncbi:hypothetical protein E2C01_067588 [Portunus trituberculatus]|uniref:Uncharacterized protein n=1 Tax=Portunus trituberculatus TaxID=210409 RepID=A0A5B7HTZ9_PORTR|nr:hypothetical protein [Portunus trituberculatus]